MVADECRRCGDGCRSARTGAARNINHAAQRRNLACSSNSALKPLGGIPRPSEFQSADIKEVRAPCLQRVKINEIEHIVGIRIASRQ
jgi:hypothetical protein